MDLKNGTIQERFEQTLEILKYYWKEYLFLNVLLFVVGVFLFFILLGVISFAFQFTILSGEYFFYIFLILILLFGLRTIQATMFIGNFYLTKNIQEEKTISIKELFLLSYKKLGNKALVDFWYFIIFIYLLVILIVLGLLGNLLSSISHELLFVYVPVAVIFYIYYYIKVTLSYYFGDYYCFDKESFDWETFSQIKKKTKGKLFDIFINLLVIALLTYIFTTIVGLLLSGITPDIEIQANLNYYLNSVTMLAIIVIVIIKYSINLLARFFSFIYMYIYYKFLTDTNSTAKSNDKVDKIEL